MKKPNDIKGLITLLETICTTHKGIASFKYDSELNFDDHQYDYPLVFVEKEKAVRTTRSEKEYTLTICVYDKPSSTSGTDMLQTEAKLEYITDDIYRMITNLQVNITDGNSLHYTNQAEDVISVTRTEFSLTLGRSNTGYGNPMQSIPDVIIDEGDYGSEV